MSGTFHNAIKGTTAGTPGTGSFTPDAAATGFEPWTDVHAGWVGLVRYEDGSAWELRFSYWDATALTRPANGLYASSTGSGLTLSSSATAAMVVPAHDVQTDLGGGKLSWWVPVGGSTTVTSVGIATTANGTITTAALATTNYLTMQLRVQYASATTANATSGISSSLNQGMRHTTAGWGGISFRHRFGASQLPTGPRLQVGLAASIAGAEPSAIVNQACFAKDSTDTNIQWMVNDGAGTATKVDTGIPLVANAWYDAWVYIPPGGAYAKGLLIRKDTGDIWYGKSTTDIPASGTGLKAISQGALNGTNTGTAYLAELGPIAVKTSF